MNDIAKKPTGDVVAYDDSLYEKIEDASAEVDDLEHEEIAGPEDRLSVGRNVRRILPPPKGSTWGPKGKPSAFKKTWEHRIEIPGSKRPLIFNCPRRMKKGVCLVCERAGELEKTGNPVDRDIAGGLFPTRKYRVNWINREKEKDSPKDALKVGYFGIKLYSQIIDLHEEVGVSFDPVKGYDLVVKRKGEDRETEYKVLQGSKCQLAEPKIGLEWIADQYDLESYAEVPPEDGFDDLMDLIEKSIAGGGEKDTRSRGQRRRSEREKDDDSRGKRNRRSSRSAQDDADDDDDDDK